MAQPRPFKNDKGPPSGKDPRGAAFNTPPVPAGGRQPGPTRGGGGLVPQPALRPVPKPKKIFADGQKYTAANTAYNSAQGSIKGFVKNPNSKTGWSFVDELGRMADARPPLKGERIISAQQIQKLNKNFYNPQAATQPTQAQPSAAQPAGALAPWLVGFAGGNGWSQTTDGGWYNTDSGAYWKTGSPIPGASQQTAAGMSGDQYTNLYSSLLKMFEGL